MLLKAARRSRHRIAIAAATFPTFNDWAIVAIILAIYGLLALAIGLPSGFLYRTEWVPGWPQVALRVFFIPALIEEMVIRVMLLPHPSEGRSPGVWWLWAGFGLVVFVGYHPLNALTLYPKGDPTFLDPIFGILAGLLGLACTLAYRLTGSLWPAAVIHWLAVVVWLVGLGGFERLAL